MYLITDNTLTFTKFKRYRKIPKISPGDYIFQRPFLRCLILEGLVNVWRGLSTEGNLRFKIDWASLIVGRKFAVFALFYFIFEDNFQVQAPRGLIFGGVIKRRVLCITRLGGLYSEGLIFRILR